MENIILEFIEDIKSYNNMSEITIKSYKSDLNGYFFFCNEKGIDIYNVYENDIKKYLEYISNRNKNSTIKRKISSLKKFYEYLLKRRKIKYIIDFSNIIDMFEFKEIYDSDKKIENNKTLDELMMELNQLEKTKDNDTLLLVSFLIIFSEINFNHLFNINVEQLKYYDYKKILIKSSNKIIDIDLEKETSEILRYYVEKYCSNAKVLFQEFKKSHINDLLKDKKLSIRIIKKIKKESRENIREKIMKRYFEIGIGDD